MGCGASSPAVGHHGKNPTQVLTRAERIAAIRMTAVTRELEPKEIKAVENIFNAADVDRSREIDDDELQRLLQSFGFALDRLSVQHITGFLRGESQIPKTQDNKNSKSKDQVGTDATPSSPTTGKNKIDFETFLKNWPSLLKYCEDLSTAMQIPLVTNPNHSGLPFDTVLAPFVDAGFGDGIVLRGDIPKAIDKITSACYEKGVLFQDSFFVPNADRVARPANRSTFDQWVRISKLADAFTTLGGGTSTGVAAPAESTKGFSVQSLLDSIANSSFAQRVNSSKANNRPSQSEPLMPLLFVQGTSSSDVLNNQWGKNRFVAGIASLADRFDLLRNTIYPLQYNPAGIYGVRVQRGGEWFWVIVDDLIPVDKNQVPVYLRSKVVNELWPLIIDKAFAKIKGSYEKVHNSPSLLLDPLYLLAGCQPATFLVPSSRDAPFPKRCDMVFSLIKTFMDHHWFVVASPSAADKDTGLVLEHCYSVLGVIEASLNDSENTEEHINQLRKITSSQSLASGDGKIGGSSKQQAKPDSKATVRLIKCRNPWGGKEWEGKWSDNDPIWAKYPNLSKIVKLNRTNTDDGVFWIQIDDLVSRFGTMHCWAVFSQTMVKVINTRSQKSRKEALEDVKANRAAHNRPTSPAAPEQGGASEFSNNEVETEGDDEGDVQSPNDQQPSRPLAAYTSTHLLKSNKQQAIQQALPKSLAAFADSLQWLSMDTCWREAGVQLNQKKALQFEFTNAQKFLLLHQGKLSVGGTAVMTPFDCPQFLITVPKSQNLNATTSGTAKASDRVTFYFRVRRLILGKQQEKRPTNDNVKSEKSIFTEGNSDVESDSSDDDEEQNAAFLKEAISKSSAHFPSYSDSDADHIMTAGGFTSEASTAKFLSNPNVVISAPQVFLVQATPKPSTAAAVNRFNMSVRGTASVSTNPLHDNGEVESNEADARERLLSIPAGKGIIAHSTGAYTKVTLPPGDYVLMAMVSDACEVPMKLVIRTKATDGAPLVIKTIKPCGGVVATSDLRPEALSEVIERHTAFLEWKEKVSQQMTAAGLNKPTSTTTTTTTTSLGATLGPGGAGSINGGRFQIPSLQVANSQVTKETFTGNQATPEPPHQFTPILNVIPRALTVKQIAIVAITDRDFNFSKDRAGEFTIGTLKNDSKMLTTKTTITKTDSSTGKATTISGTYFDWKEITNDNHSSEEQQLLNGAKSVLGGHGDLTSTAADGGTGAASGRSGISYATASSKTFGFYNLVTVRYQGAGHPFSLLPFFTGERLTNPNTNCVVAVWSPDGSVDLKQNVDTNGGLPTE